MMRHSTFSTLVLLLFTVGPTVQGNTEKTSDRTRVFITDSQSWAVSGGFFIFNGGGGGVRGGARPQSAEIMKTFGKRCPENTVTLKQEQADFIVLLDHEGGKHWIRKDNKVAVFNMRGDMIYSGSTRNLGNAVTGACNAIRKELNNK